jgi:hypothetical protein
MQKQTILYKNNIRLLAEGTPLQERSLLPFSLTRYTLNGTAPVMFTRHAVSDVLAASYAVPGDAPDSSNN